MNILFCYKNWMNPNLGGVQRVSDTLGKFFVSEGYNLYYLTHIYDKKDTYDFPANSIYNLPDPDFFSSVNREYYHRILYERSIDIVINHDASNLRSRFFLNTGHSSVKKISIYHTDPLYGITINPDLGNIIRNVFFRKLIIRRLTFLIRLLKIVRKRKELKTLLRDSDKIVLLSEQFKKQIESVTKISSAKITAISNPIQSINTVNGFEKRKQVLFVARMELKVKRPDLMLQVWDALKNDIGDWELIFLGDGPDRKYIESLSSKLELKNISFKGHVDPQKYYQQASIICMTSDYEGFGIVLVEAMNHRVVPMAFDNWESLKDIIIDEENGILIPSNDIEKYSQKLQYLMYNSKHRLKIASNAEKYVEKFHINKIGPQWVKLFSELL